MATYRKRSGGWRAEVCKKGVRDSKTFPTKAHAVAWAIQREAEILAGTSQQKASDFTFKQALEKYRDEVSPTKAGSRWETLQINRLLTVNFAEESIKEVGADLIAAWRDARLKKVKTSTVRREMNLLASIFEIARTEWKWCKGNPVREIKRPPNRPPRDRRISAEEEKLLLDALGYVEGQPPRIQKQEVAYAFLIALETAMRCGEILNLTLDRVHLKESYVRLMKTKNGTARHVALSKRAVQLMGVLEQVARQQERDKLFTVNSANADVLFRGARDPLPIENLCFHDTRHEAITRLARKLEILDLARTIGHKDLRSLMTYYNATASEIAGRLG
ncbi:integrase [Ventosimonas gracilis]|uniref:Integrase n=1 Tax=Ventosimonas gracilis TaxID=1680762 RepID=A0A139SUI6_9GAMM|nr:site-specific integrase [Ventosimonas gracilis]KXU38253.1 integrase [Ventosimonas gracilis]